MSCKKKKRLFLGIVLLGGLFVSGCSALWIHINTYPPTSDQEFVWNAAIEVSRGEVITKSNYFQEYPNQAGTVLLESLLIRLFKNGSKNPVRIVNIACSGLMAAGQPWLCLEIFSSRRIALQNLILSVLFFPVIIYTTFVYGTLFSITCVLYSFIFLLIFMQKNHFVYGIISAVILNMGIMAYQAALIAWIAEIIFLLLFVSGKNKGKRAKIFLILVVLILSVPANERLCRSWLHAKAGITSEDVIPSSAWLLMGISSEKGTNGPGSHDSSDLYLFNKNNRNEAETSKEAVSRIREVIGEYFDGTRSWTFFLDKTIYQWLDPWFDSLPMTIYPDFSPENERTFKYVQPELFQNIQVWYRYSLPVAYTYLLTGGIFLLKEHKKKDSNILLLLYFIVNFL